MSSEVKDLRNDLLNLESEYHTLKAQRDRLAIRVATLDDKLQQADKANKKITDELLECVGKRQDLEIENDKLEQQIKQLQSALEEVREENTKLKETTNAH